MDEKPRGIYILVLLWLLLSLIFIMWGLYSLELALDVLSWSPSTMARMLYPMLFFGTLISATTWFVFGCLFFIFAYGTFKGIGWVWTSGIIISTIFLVIFGFMLASFMVTASLFLDFFSVMGIVTVVISFLIDLGIIYFITRPHIKVYF